MVGLVIGLGEVGSALYEILNTKYPTKSFDIKKGGEDFPFLANEILHICIPYSDTFVADVQHYIDTVKPKFTIVHSSVPVGTCAKLVGNVFHSPVRGTHPDMKRGLLLFLKYISNDLHIPEDVKIICDYFDKVGIHTKYVNGFKTTELMKLLELCRYGVYLAFAKEQERICNHFGVDYNQAYLEYERSSNEGLRREDKDYMQQPLLYPFDKFIGGHCTLENMKLTLEQIETPLLKEAYRIGRGTVIWPNCNVYPGAKIGKGCSVGQFTEIDDGVVIGNNVRIGAYCFIPNGVTIEDDCFIAPRVSFSNDKHPPSKKQYWGKILVKKGAAIGMGAVILPGVTIGENAVVGAGGVVTKDVAPGKIVYGMAAYERGKVDEVYRFEERLAGLC